MSGVWGEGGSAGEGHSQRDGARSEESLPLSLTELFPLSQVTAQVQREEEMSSAVAVGLAEPGRRIRPCQCLEAGARVL